MTNITTQRDGTVETFECYFFLRLAAFAANITAFTASRFFVFFDRDFFFLPPSAPRRFAIKIFVNDYLPHGTDDQI